MPVVVAISFQLVMKLIANVYLAYQSHSIQVKIHFATQVLSVLIVWILNILAQNQLF